MPVISFSQVNKGWEGRETVEPNINKWLAKLCLEEVFSPQIVANYFYQNFSLIFYLCMQ